MYFLCTVEVPQYFYGQHFESGFQVLIYHFEHLLYLDTLVRSHHNPDTS